MKKLQGTLYKEGETAQNYSEQSYEQLEAGAYVCEINHVMDSADKEMLTVEFDIVEGEHTDYFKKLSDRAGFWGGTVNLLYRETLMNRFKRACQAINYSNPGYIFNPFDDGKNADEKTLEGKKFGIVLHEEEYKKKDGSIGHKMAAFPWSVIKTESARSGDFNKKLMDPVTLKEESSADNAFMPSGEEVIFN